MDLSMSQRKAVTNKLASAYRRGSKKERSAILDQVVSLTGWHRDYARAQLRQAGTVRVHRPHAPRAPLYGARIVVALTLTWRALRMPSGKRLAPALAVVVPMLRSDGELDLTDEETALLVSMSAATIDRRLSGERALLGLRGRSHTKPGTLLKSQIPVRTWADWDTVVPGFIEIDLVGHEGGNSTGEFCFTLTMTDIATGWTLKRSVKNKAAVWVFEALTWAIERFPFPILGIDSDNGSEFINHHLLAYCEANEITFTRSRSGNKNDGCHVEQKNWSEVRTLVGYLRFDTDAELSLLNEIWELDETFTNYLICQQKLVYKQREGSKVTKRYDRAQTPAQRALADPTTSERSRGIIETQLADIHPGELSRDIEDLCSRLENLALAKAPAPMRPKVNRSFNEPKDPEVSREATIPRSRRF
jgi:hypothetical protein